MGAESHELEHIVVLLAIDENEIGFDVAVTVVCPLAGECVIPERDWQIFVGAE